MENIEKNRSKKTNYINNLIYLYLKSNNYIESAKIFHQEGQIREIYTNLDVSIFNILPVINDFYLIRNGYTDNNSIIKRIETLIFNHDLKRKRLANRSSFNETEKRGFQKFNFDKTMHKNFIVKKEYGSREDRTLFKPNVQYNDEYASEANNESISNIFSPNNFSVLKNNFVECEKYQLAPINNIEISPISKIIFITHQDGTFSFFSSSKFEDKKTYKLFDSSIIQAVIHEDEQFIFGLFYSQNSNLIFCKFKSQCLSFVEKMEIDNTEMLSSFTLDSRSIYISDKEGELQQFNMAGNCEGMVILKESAIKIIYIKKFLFLISDSNSLYIYDFESQEIINELIGHRIDLMRKFGEYIVISEENNILIYDDNFNQINKFQMGDKISAINLLDDENIFMASKSKIFVHHDSKLDCENAHLSPINDLNIIENEDIYIYSGACDGELKIFKFNSK